MLNYPLFFRKFGIRRKEQLLSPIFTPFSALELPFKSLLHYIPATGAIGPAINDFGLRDRWRFIYVSHVQELRKFEGAPRFVTVNYLSRIRDYQHSASKLMWLKKDVNTVTDPRSLVVVSYGGIDANYVYRRDLLATLYRFRNDYATVYSHVNDIAISGGRNQFLVIDVPDILPNRNRFDVASQNITPQHLKIFRTPALKFLLDMWIWLGESRPSSVLSTIAPDALKALNLVFKHNDQAVILNLGLVDSWRKDTTVEDGDLIGLRPEQIQKLFLRMLLDLTAPVTEAPVVIDGLARKELRAVGGGRPEDIDEDVLEAEEAAEPELPVAEIDFSEVDRDLDAHSELSDTGELIDDLDMSVDAPETTVAVKPAAVPYTAPRYSLSDTITRRAKKGVEQATLSLAEYQRFTKLSTSYETIPNPWGEGTLKDLLTITPADLNIDQHTPIADIPTVLDKSMLKSTLIDFDSRYVKNVLHKDIANMVMGLQQAGIAITGFSVKEKEDVMNHFHVYTISVAPVAGRPSTIIMEVPVIDDDGVMLAGGVKYYLKKQHGEMPIRKTAPTRVSLTSYFGKVFIDRSENVVNNYGLWLANHIRTIGLDIADTRITDMRLSRSFNHRVILPRLYTLLSQNFSAFTLNVLIDGKPKVIELSFDYENRHTLFGASALSEIESNNRLLVGRSGGSPIVMFDDGRLADGAGIGIPTLEELLDLPVEKAPNEIAVLNLFGKVIPLGFILAYRLTLPTLIATLGVEYRRVDAGKQLKLQPDEYRLKFKDESWIFSKKDKVAAMLIGGFNVFHQSIARYRAADFVRPDVFLNIVEDSGLGIKYVREVDLMFDLFIDHITRELLIEMHEPTDMFNLLIRATQLLLVDYYPDEGDKRFMRIKGYERIAGAVYGELVRAARSKQNNASIVKSMLSVNPMAVKLAILTDSAKEIVEDINPIHNLKQAETVTFGGSGGRSTKTMVKSTRAYHETDKGVMSEATVDSGNVGIIAYLSADPNFNSLRGTTRRYDTKRDGLSSLLSTSAILSPASTSDDTKRTNFSSIQHSHGIACKGYVTSPLVTGYEQVLAHRTSDIFAYTAKQDGTVTARTANTIAITYTDGTVKYIETGRRFGKAKGSAYPHDVTTDLKVGDTFKFGDTIVYNTNFFVKDRLNPKGLSWKAGVLTRTAIMDTTDTFEDSCAISAKIAGDLTSETTFIRNIVVNFDQAVGRLVNTGDAVEVDSILCTIEDSVTAGSDLFDADTLHSLRLLSNSTPRAKNKGVVEKIEVFYNGEIVDMSESLAYLAQIQDRQLTRLKRNLGKNDITGKVDSGYRIDGNPLGRNQLVINVYITGSVPAGVGDKAVFGNQLKTIVGRVMTGINRSVDGRDIDAIFGYMSISNRIVLSPEIMGTTNVLLEVIGLRAAKIYRGNKDV